MRASDRAYAALLDDIQSGALPPGTVLGETEQSARLGVSRTPLREALTRLGAAGLVTQLSPRVTAVAAIGVGDIRDLFDLRRALEEAGARLAATRADRAVFAALSERFRNVRFTADPATADDYYALVAAFDAAFDAAVGNGYLVSALTTVRTHLVRVRRRARTDPVRLTASATEHGLIAAAIAAGDADLAAHAVHIHLHHALTSALAGTAGTHDTPGAS